MTDHRVLLLRGVNVGGRGRLAMALLREIATDLGYADPATYLQSGNLVVASRRPAEEVAAELRAALAERAGLDVAVVARTGAEIATVLAANPLPAPADPARFFVSFCSRPVGDALDGLDPTEYAPEEFGAVGREIYSWLPGGMNGTRLPTALWERRTRDVVTARNWRTVQALAALCGS